MRNEKGQDKNTVFELQIEIKKKKKTPTATWPNAQSQN